MSDYEQAVSISYAWGGEREDIVNDIDETLQQRGIRIVRDKRALGYRGSIKEFMERIGRGSCIIVVISDKYLRSPNCMFELVEIAENKQFHDRIFPVVLSDANIYDPLKRIEYIKFWEGKRKELAKAMKTLDPANLHGIREEMDQYDRIRDKISGITSILKDMNTLTPDMHRDSEFSNLYDAIVERLRESSTDVTTEFDEMTKKAEVERKAKEAERLAQQKAEEDRLAKVEADSKAKEEADRLTAKKAEEERAAKAKAENEQKDKAAAAQKAEADRKAKEEADRIAAKKAEEERAAKAQKAIPVEPKAMPVAVAPVTKKPASKRLIYGVGAVVLLAIVGVVFSLVSNGGNKNEPAATPSAMAATKAPATATLAPASTATIALTPTPSLGIGSSMISEKDGMTLLYVPAGEFTMGSNDGVDNEKPAHKVYLDSFWIDQTEVTNKMYAMCVAAGDCQPPVRYCSHNDAICYENSRFDSYPVLWVDWNHANNYCEWAGRQLPTEAQWEKAARGTDGRTYPWGNNEPDETLANFYPGRNPFPVGSYPKGASPYGALDMAGNVSEMVADWYSATYYASSPTSNPLGPSSGDEKVYRGGNYFRFSVDLNSTNRSSVRPTEFWDSVGFRCAMSANP